MYGFSHTTSEMLNSLMSSTLVAIIYWDNPLVISDWFALEAFTMYVIQFL